MSQLTKDWLNVKENKYYQFSETPFKGNLFNKKWLNKKGLYNKIDFLFFLFNER